MPTSGLTWADAVKLCVPFAFSLILLWAKQWYETHEERKAKGELLWRSIDQDATEIIKVLDELDHIAVAYERGRMRLVAIVLPQAAVVVGARLAELDHAHAHVFMDYVAQVGIVQAGLARLERLTDRAIEGGKESLGSLPKAIRAQVASLRRDFVTLAESDLQVLTALRAADQRLDAQVISRLTNVLQDARRKVSETPAAVS